MVLAFVKFLRTLRSIVEELSDHRAYRLHLQSHSRQHSAETYRNFQKEHFRRKYERAKCC